MNEDIIRIASSVLDDNPIDITQIKTLMQQTSSKSGLFDMLYWANKIREKHFGNKVSVCSIVPGRLGGCNQDCAFCAQSVRYDTHIDKTPEILSDEQILAAAAEAKKNGVPNFGIVYSGKAVTEDELVRLEKLIAQIKADYGLGMCASLGIISEEQAQRLADHAGG